ncbi:MAG TPA: substrate-binding domain-containing protein [Candidatus Limnocylindrales bacterium]|nr:substrate-binding domain-containing protein [Candidatus Limnocylindrales bacterium]
MAGRYTRRDFLKLTAGAGAGIVVAACSSTPGASSAPSSVAPAGSSAASVGASAAPSSAPSAGAASASPGPLNFLTWSDHWSKDEIKGVKESTGIEVNITELADNIDGYNKLQQVHGQLDLVSGDALWVPHYYDAGLVQPIDISSFQVASQLYSMARSFDFWTKPDGYLAYPWGWSPIQIVFNPANVSPAPDSWQVLVDPKYKGRIVMEKQPTDIMLFAGVATGAKDIYNMTPDELAAAKDWLTKLKPNVKRLVQQNNETIQALASGEAWLATQNIGAPDRVKDAGGPQVEAIVPKEGTTGFIDGEMTVKGGDNQARVQPYLEAGAQAEYVAQNFLDNGRPLFNEKAYQLLVDKGQKERADRYLYNQPEQALNMRLKGPAGNTDAYIQAFNEVFGG